MEEKTYNINNEVIIGIYSITCDTNNKKYIGQSNNIYKRWKEHLGSLRNNKHYNKLLQRSFNKYGEENFKFRIIKNIEIEGYSIENINELEIMYINEFKTFDRNFGYNLTLGGSSSTFVNLLSEEEHKKWRCKISNTKKGSKLSEQTKQRMSISRMGYGNNNYGKRGYDCSWCVPIVCVTTYEVFSSAREASIKYNIYSSQITETCQGKFKFAGKLNEEFLCWAYKDDIKWDSLSDENKNELRLKMIYDAKTSRNGENNARARSVICLNTGELFKTAKMGAEKYNTRGSSVTLCCQRKNKSCGIDEKGKRLNWMYYEDYYYAWEVNNGK